MDFLLSNFTGTDLRQAQLSGAGFTGVQFIKTKIDKKWKKMVLDSLEKSVNWIE